MSQFNKVSKNAIKNKADYLAFGAFHASNKKSEVYCKNQYLINKKSKYLCCNGGINSNNYKKLLLIMQTQAISFHWNNKI